MAQKVNITLQIGTLFDGSDNLHHSLRKNLPLLKRLDVLVPKPHWYTDRLMNLVAELAGAPADKEQLVELWADLRNAQTGHRTVLSEPRLLAKENELFGRGMFLPSGHRRPTMVRSSFGAEINTEFFLSLRNPASLVDAALRHFDSRDLDGLLVGTDPFSIRWSDVIARLRTENPASPIVVWMKEEQPYAWPQLMHMAAGFHGPVMTSGVADAVASVLRPEVATHLEAYLKKYDNYDPEFLARAFEHFAQKYAAPDQRVEVIDVPGWSAQTVSDLTAAYMEDLDAVSRIEGITFLSA